MAQVCELVTEPASSEQSLHLHEPTTHVFLGANGDTDQVEGWHLDTGATSHMTGRAAAFSELDHAVQGTVWFDDGFVIPIQGRGIVTFTSKTGEQIKLVGVLYIPRLKNNIIYLGQLDERGCKVEINNGVLTVWDRRCRLLVKIHRSKNRLYILRSNVADGVCLRIRQGEDEVDEQWHARYGHIGYDVLHQLSHQDMVIGLLEVEKKGVCDTCIVTKQRCAPFPTKANYQATAALDLVHGDLCGSISPATLGGRRYILLLVDDAT
jgi:hypothetical protein